MELVVITLTPQDIINYFYKHYPGKVLYRPAVKFLYTVLKDKSEEIAAMHSVDPSERTEVWHLLMDMLKDILDIAVSRAKGRNFIDERDIMEALRQPAYYPMFSGEHTRSPPPV